MLQVKTVAETLGTLALALPQTLTVTLALTLTKVKTVAETLDAGELKDRL